jgi:hypothetical protein
MIALVLAVALVGPVPTAEQMAVGNWLVVAVQRVIAPDQMQGQCFVQGRVEQVVHGRAFRPGDAIAMSLPCRAGGITPTAAGPRPEVPTIQGLRAAKRALVHVDAAGRVLENGFYAAP